jgi:hypothetical protein
MRERERFHAVSNFAPPYSFLKLKRKNNFIVIYVFGGCFMDLHAVSQGLEGENKILFFSFLNKERNIMKI